MPYAPSVAPWSARPSDYTAGQSQAGAISSIGNSISQGMDRWFLNDKLDTQTRAQVAGLLPQAADLLTNPEDKKLVEDFINHKSDYRDNGYLLGVMTTALGQKKQQQAMQLQQAQIDDFASQAKQRNLQAQLAQRNYDMMGQLLQGGTPVGQPQGAPQGQMAPQGQAAPPQAQATAPEPTLRDSFLELARNTGQLPDARTASTYFQAKHDAWGKIEQPIGYVAGGQEKVENVPFTNYYRIVRRNDGSLVQEKEPLKVYSESAPPGQILDPNTFKPIPPPPTPSGAPAVKTPPSKDQQDAMLEAANDLNVMKVQRNRLNTLFALNKRLDDTRPSRLAPIIGTDLGNKILTVAANDTTGRQFNSAASQFISDLMGSGGVKNIRNVLEFKAVTGSVPTSDQDDHTRFDRLAEIANKLNLNITRTQRALGNMQAGSLPSDAWTNASSDAKEVVHHVFKDEASAMQAVRDKRVEDGDIVTIGSKTLRWEAPKK